MIEGGIRPNVVAERTVLQVDLRAVDRASMEAADAAIRALAAAPAVPDVTIDVDLRHRHWPMEKLPRSGRLVELAQGLAAGLGFEVRDAATGGASDANTTAGLGVPSLDGLGPIGGMDHSPEEWLDVTSIVPRTALFAALLLATGRDPEVRSWRAGAAGLSGDARPARARGGRRRLRDPGRAQHRDQHDRDEEPEGEVAAPGDDRGAGDDGHRLPADVEHRLPVRHPPMSTSAAAIAPRTAGPTSRRYSRARGGRCSKRGTRSGIARAG